MQLTVSTGDENAPSSRESPPSTPRGAGRPQDRDRGQPPTSQTDGVESNGMVLAASIDGEPSLLSVDTGVPAGTKVK